MDGLRDFLRWGVFAQFRPLVFSDGCGDESSLTLFTPGEPLSTRAEAREVASTRLAAIGLSAHVEFELGPEGDHVVIEIPTA